MISPEYLNNVEVVVTKLVEAKKQQQQEINELVELLDKLAEHYMAMARELRQEKELDTNNT